MDPKAFYTVYLKTVELELIREALSQYIEVQFELGLDAEPYSEQWNDLIKNVARAERILGEIKWVQNHGQKRS